MQQRLRTTALSCFAVKAVVQTALKSQLMRVPIVAQQ